MVINITIAASTMILNSHPSSLNTVGQRHSSISIRSTRAPKMSTNNNNNNNDNIVVCTMATTIGRFHRQQSKIRSSSSLSLSCHGRNNNNNWKSRLMMNSRSNSRRSDGNIMFPTTTTQLYSSLIPSNDPFGNWFILTGCATFGQYISQTTKIGKLLGGPVSAMFISFLLSSISIISSGGTIASSQLQLLSLQYATPFILLGASIKYSILKQCGPLFISFIMASFATIVACSIGWYCTGTMLTNSFLLSSNSNKVYDGIIIASALLAKNIGGGINYIAICQTFHASTNAIAAGLCIDNIFALIYFPLSSYIASKVVIKSDTIDSAKIHNANMNPHSIITEQIQSNTYTDSNTTIAATTNTSSNIISTKEVDKDDQQSFSIQNMSFILFIATALLWISQCIGRYTILGISSSLPICTCITVLIVSIIPMNIIQPYQKVANTFGMVCLYLFFATAGSSGIAVAQSVRSSLIPISLYLTCLYTIHTFILTLFHYTFRQRRDANKEMKTSSTTSTKSKLSLLSLKQLLADAAKLEYLLLASSAAIGGPATAVALAASVKWKTLETPSILIGNVGYTIATFCGIIFYNILKPT